LTVAWLPECNDDESYLMKNIAVGFRVSSYIRRHYFLTLPDTLEDCSCSTLRRVHDSHTSWLLLNAPHRGLTRSETARIDRCLSPAVVCEHLSALKITLCWTAICVVGLSIDAHHTSMEHEILGCFLATRILTALVVDVIHFDPGFRRCEDVVDMLPKQTSRSLTPLTLVRLYATPKLIIKRWIP